MLRTVFAQSRLAARRTPMLLQFRFYSNKLTANSPVTAYGESPLVRYTDNHEWIAVHKDNVGFVGITKYAADALGETTYVEVPEVGTEVDAKDTIGSVESVKSASDLYSPVAGEVVAINEQLPESPDLINSDPMGEAWFAQIKIGKPEDLEELMDYEQYEKFLKENE